MLGQLANAPRRLATIALFLLSGLTIFLAARQRHLWWYYAFMATVGAVIGGYVMSLFGKPGVTGLDLYSILVAIGGAVVLLLVLGLFRR